MSFPIDIATTGIAQAQVSIANPFTATLNLLSVVANGTYNALYLGQVNVSIIYCTSENAIDRFILFLSAKSS